MTVIACADVRMFTGERDCMPGQTGVQLSCLEVYEHSLVHTMTYMRAYVSVIACLDMYVHT